VNLNKRFSETGKKLIAFSGEDSTTSDQFRMIRTNINFLPGEKTNKVFLVTSPSNKEGKSTTVANLAVSMAQQNEKILLIDANLKNPAIHHLFDVPSQVGLIDILMNQKRFDEAVYSTDIGELDILVSGITSSNPAELLGNETMTHLLKLAAKMYSVVLIDAPSVLKTTETHILANQCDGVILVLQRGKTKLDKVVEAKRTLELAHSNLVGSIINEK
jgi:capsular exopolysaccharide synthesis family protein